MWIVQLKIIQNCVIANRCKQFNVVSYSISLTAWTEGRYHFTSHRHTLFGSEKNVQDYLNDLQKDPEVVSIEISGNTVLLLQRRKTRELVTSNVDPRMFLVKPVFCNQQGEKFCEFASWHKETLIAFVERMKKANDHLEVRKFVDAKLKDIHFPKVLPNLTEKQKEAFHLAVQHGYYTQPREAHLEDLAPHMGVSVSTFQEHLRKAEAKILPTYRT